MKRLFLSIVGICIAVLTSTAASPTLDELLGESCNGIVTLRNVKDAYASKVLTPRADGKLEMQTKGNLGEKDNWNQVWLLERTSSAEPYTYTLRNLLSGEYIGNGPQLGAALSHYLRESTLTAGAFNISTNSDFSGMTLLNLDNANNQLCYWWGGSFLDQNSDWRIEPASEVSFEEAKAHLVSMFGGDKPENGKIYKIKNRAYGTMISEMWGGGNLLGKAEDAEDVTQCWRVVQSGTGYAFQSVSTEKYIQGEPGMGAEFRMGASPVYFQLDAVEGKFESQYGIHPGSPRGLHQSASQGNYIVSWDYKADPSRWLFSQVEMSEEDLAAARASYAAYLKSNESLEGTQNILLAFFDDALCTRLKPEYQSMTDGELREAMSALPVSLQDEAVKVKNDAWSPYEKEFRVAEYGAFSSADRGASVMCVAAMGLRNNPTGVIGDAREGVYILVGDDIPEGTTLTVEARVGYCVGSPDQSKTLTKGLNYIYVENDNSHIFVNYTSPDDAVIADVPKLGIRVMGGRLNGYFDKTRHDDADWVAMREAGLLSDYVTDILGIYSQLTVQTEGVVQYNPTKILPLLNEYEWYCYTELELMGLTSVPDSLASVEGASEAYDDLFPRIYNNRMLVVSFENSWDMNAASYRVCLGDGYMDTFYNYDYMKNRGSEVWAPAHEMGHFMQHAIRLQGTVEVTNNLFSNVMVHKGGTCTSRGWNLQNMQTQMENGTHDWPHIVSNDIWLATQLFYQLYLYYHVAGNNPLFYQRLFHLMREDRIHQGGVTAQKDYIHFFKKACDAAEEDLTEFFDYWGFLKPVDGSEYPECGLSLTNLQINNAKKHAKRYEKKCNPAMIFIDDRVVTTYKSDGVTPKDAFGGEYPVSACETNLEGAQYSNMIRSEAALRDTADVAFAKSSGQIKFTNEQVEGAAGIKLLDKKGKLLYAFSDKSQSFLKDYLKSIRDEIHAAEVCFPDGNVMVYLNQATLDEITGIEDVECSLKNDMDAPVYDLQGRKVDQPVSGRIYIVGGQKVLNP